MANSNVIVRPASTAWGAVLGGWVATIGASVIFAPLVAGLLVGAPVGGDIAVAVPVVLGLFLSYIVGGYVAGRMAGYRTSWHGMMTAFFTLFIVPTAYTLLARTHKPHEAPAQAHAPHGQAAE